MEWVDFRAEILSGTCYWITVLQRYAYSARFYYDSAFGIKF